jgi:hypothetical protein
MKSVAASPLLDLRQTLGQRHLGTWSVDHAGNPVVVSIRQSETHADEDGSSRLNHFGIHDLGGLQPRVIELPPSKQNYPPLVQPLGTNQWLTVSPRAGTGEEANAQIVGPTGDALGTFRAGNGIEDLQTTASGDIWISYFDEGVFRGDGFGQAGLVCLDDTGQLRFSFNEVAPRANLPPIYDCYALNVSSDDDVWLHYYEAFPLVHLHRREATSIFGDLPVDGGHALAINGQQVLLAGVAGDEIWFFSIGSRVAEQLTPVDAAGLPLHPQSPTARGSRLYFSDRDALWAIDLTDL